MNEPTPDPEVDTGSTPDSPPDTAPAGTPDSGPDSTPGSIAGVAAEAAAPKAKRSFLTAPRVLVASAITAVALAGGTGFAVGLAVGDHSDEHRRGRFGPPPGFDGRDGQRFGPRDGQQNGLPPSQQLPAPAQPDNSVDS